MKNDSPTIHDNHNGGGKTAEVSSLAAGAARHTLARGTLLATRHAHALPGPARARGAQDLDLGSGAGDAARDAVQGQAGNRDTKATSISITLNQFSLCDRLPDSP